MRLFQYACTRFTQNKNKQMVVVGEIYIKQKSKEFTMKTPTIQLLPKTRGTWHSKKIKDETKSSRMFMFGLCSVLYYQIFPISKNPYVKMIK